MNRVFGQRGPWLAILIGVFAAALVAGCKINTRDNPAVCNPPMDMCAADKECRENKCVPRPTGGASGSGGAVGSGGVAAGGDAGTASGGIVGGGGAGGRGGAGGHTTGGTDAGVDGKGGSTDAGPECSDNGGRACLNEKQFCMDSKCVDCRSDVDCEDPKKPICSGLKKTCVSCTEADPMACASHLATPVCARISGQIGACVKCDSNVDCKENKTTPICNSMNTCIACSAAGGDSACKTATPALPICSTTATQAGACVECGKDTDCSADPNKPFCSATGTCVGCAMPTMANMGACAARTMGKPACAASGACVQCVINVDCPSTSPVCSAGNTCGPCSGDNDCGVRYGPSVCMPSDGRCATDGETIYVKAGGMCNDAPQTLGGTMMVPYCSMVPVPAAITSARSLVVVRGAVNGASSPFGAGAAQISIVGQQSALIGGVSTGIRVTSGDVSVRDLTVTTTAAIGIQAESGATLHLQHVSVNNNMGGGILLDGAAFEIRNSTVKGNGPGDMAGTAWGGIRIVSPPATGSKDLQNVTIQGNNGGGLSCTAMVQGMGVLAIDNTNTPNQITTSCGFSSCAAASATCGAQ